MYTYEVCGFPRSITVGFRCPKCGKELEEDVWIPEPDYLSEKDTFNGTRNDEYVVIECACGEKVTIQTTGSCSGNFIYIDGLEPDYPVNVYEENDDYLSYELESIPDKDYYDVFKSSIDDALMLTKLSNLMDSQKTIVNSLVYAQLVTCMETFLYDALFTCIFEDEAVKRRFVENYKPFQSQKISLSGIYKKHEVMDETIKKELIDIQYHNISKIKGIFESSIKIKFPEIEGIEKIVETRHDLVHRNGKDKKGNKIEISDEILLNAYREISSFIASVYHCFFVGYVLENNL